MAAPRGELVRLERVDGRLALLLSMGPYIVSGPSTVPSHS